MVSSWLARVIGREAGRMATVDQELGVRSQNRTTRFQQRHDVVFDLEDLAFGATAKGGRIEDDAVVAIAASGLAVDKFDGVIDKPANGPPVQV